MIALSEAEKRCADSAMIIDWQATCEDEEVREYAARYCLGDREVYWSKTPLGQRLWRLVNEVSSDHLGPECHNKSTEDVMYKHVVEDPCQGMSEADVKAWEKEVNV